MKKSVHSILTAAMFAAAVTTSLGNPAAAAQTGASSEASLMAQTGREQQGVYGPPNWFETEPEQPELTDPEPQDVYGPPNWYTTDSEGNPVTDIEPQPDYGPPHWESETSTTAETTIFTEPITQPAYGPPYWETTVTEIIPQPAYGPPWMFAEPGDLNYDFQLDARDLTLLKRYLLEGEINDHIDRLANVNHDGKIDKEDVKELIRKLTGKPEDEEEPDVTTTATTATTQTADTETTTTDPWENYPLPLYGPPAAY